MESPTNPYRFDSTLRAALLEQQANILTCWNRPLTPYTTLIKNTVLPEVGKRLGLTPHPYEHYSLDCIYVAEYDTEHFGPDSGYPKAFSVIVEHENMANRSCEEMSKLLLFNAPLKVLITYARSGHGLENHLARYVKMIESSGNSALAVASQRILVIFCDKPLDIPIWRSYLYGSDKFTEITPKGA